MSEQWLSIFGFSDYAVSNLGRIRRIVPDSRGRTMRILKPCTAGRYAQVTLYKNRIPFIVCVHRAVCVAFRGLPPSTKHHAAHSDGNRSNNKSSNLRWKTPSENEADKVLHGTSRLGKPSAIKPERMARGHRHGRHTMPERTARGERIWTSKLTAAKVVAIRKDMRSRKAIAEGYGITVTMVGYIQRRLSWAHVS